MSVYPIPLSLAILSIRKRKNITQAELGKIIAVASNTVSRWERGEMIPGAWQLISLHGHARTEEEIGPILQALELKGIALGMHAGAEAHETSIAPSGEACNA